MKGAFWAWVLKKAWKIDMDQMKKMITKICDIDEGTVLKS